ncbi:MAG: GTPase ObgE [Rudaea sp.]
MSEREEGLFFDEVTIEVKGGAGGDGVVAFRREKFVPRGGPSGGSGGRGGDVILAVNPQLNTLIGFRRRKHFEAGRGEHGSGKNQNGANGKEIIIAVPPGTIVRDLSTGELLGDLLAAGQELVVAHGGRGGRGNAAFASSTNQAPRFSEKGEKGENRRLRLELKLIADVGIIGEPNAGKSTFLSSVTAARPKIADYPFTTLAPNLGVAEVDDRTLVLADIPGLIEGAHEGAGLGDRFLRHIERTRLLIHLLDGSRPDPLADFDTINRELAEFNPGLAAKPQMVGFNKMDLPDAQKHLLQVRSELNRRGVEVIPLSAATGEGVRELLRRAALLLAEMPHPQPEPAEAMPVFRPEPDENAFEVSRRPVTLKGGKQAYVYQVTGRKAERVIAMTNWSQDEGAARAHRVLQAMGVTDALRAAGIREGDAVQIGDIELEWSEGNIGR